MEKDEVRIKGSNQNSIFDKKKPKKKNEKIVSKPKTFGGKTNWTKILL